jgi:hypothetical protein
MKPTSKDQFKEQFLRRPLNDQVQSYLCALAARNGGVLEFEFDEVMNVQDGDTCVVFVDGNKLLLKYSPEMTLIYSVRRGEQQQWAEQHANQTMAQQHQVHTDQSLADLEMQNRERERIRQQAQKMREEVEPLTGATRLRTSRNSPV